MTPRPLFLPAFLSAFVCSRAVAAVLSFRFIPQTISFGSVALALICGRNGEEAFAHPYSTGASSGRSMNGPFHSGADPVLSVVS